MRRFERLLYRLVAFLVLFALPVALVAQVSGLGAYLTPESVARDGTPAQIDFPRWLWVRNEGGSDGAGLCVFRSATNSGGIWHRDRIEGFFDWMKRKPGGGYPSKFAKMLTQYCNEQGIEEPAYVQVQSSDQSVSEILDLLERAVNDDLMPAITYSFSPSGRYGGGRVSHMVNLVAARAGPSRLWAIMDNNYDSSYEWMSENDFRRTFGGGGAWAIIFLSPGPPPVPRN